MSPPSQTTFLLIPGAFCPSTFFSLLTPLLTASGYSALALDNPSFGKSPSKPPASGYDDAAALRSTIERFADQGQNIILVANSYGGFVASEGTKNMSRRDRAAAGKPGGVVHIILLSSILVQVGQTVKDVLQGLTPFSMEVEEGGDAYLPMMTLEMLGDMPVPLFQSLERGEQLKYAAMCREHCALAFADKATYAGYEHVPTTVVIGGRDVAFSVAFQEEQFEKAVERGVQGLRRVLLDGDHCMMLSQPEETAKVCLEVAEGI
ncbi:alpha/beta-hydrolase [Polyplosphaeria fusca]|uniref:Alpha/beta-hydrolase n=1 Tax=Polyplosphaeria fusca TaxID=682080 RepID=A0A9P4UWG5_9PLEO|nr:alpha/beta-hydrolase [Polyplosphaeria fusca]